MTEIFARPSYVISLRWNNSPLLHIKLFALCNSIWLSVHVLCFVRIVKHLFIIYFHIFHIYIALLKVTNCDSPGRAAYIWVLLITRQIGELYQTQLKRSSYQDSWHSNRASDYERNRMKCFIIQLWPLSGILLTHLCQASHKMNSGKQ